MNSIRKIITQDLFPEDLNIWLRIVYGTGTEVFHKFDSLHPYFMLSLTVLELSEFAEYREFQ